MRRLPALVVGVTLLLSGTAASSHAAVKRPKPRPAPLRYYFHSAGGGYLNDWQADTGAMQEVRAPHGSTLSLSPPTGTTPATVGSSYPRVAGNPRYATFALPYTGKVTSICLDLWAKASYGPPTSPVLYVMTAIVPPGLSLADAAQGTGYLNTTDHGTVVNYDQSLVRFTKLLLFAPGTTVPAGSSLIVGGTSVVNNPDWTMSYDSTTYFSSVTFNTPTCTAQRIGGRP